MSGTLRSLLLLLSVICLLFSTVTKMPAASGWPPGADHTTIPLWPVDAPGTSTAKGPEQDTTTAKDRQVAGRSVVRIGNVSTPTMTLYLTQQPKGTTPAAIAPGSAPAVVVFPGGSYRILAIDLEGTEVCDWLNSINVNCVLVKYRVPDTGPFPKSEAALQDAQRAVGVVRAHAAEWHIDPKRVGVLGFSAGGHLVAALSTHYEQRLYTAVDVADQQSCRPDFAFIIYPGYLALAEKNFEFNPDIPVTASTPPAFLVQAEDDGVHVENAVGYFMALKKAGVPAELHTYAQGGHGYGLRPTDKPVTGWPKLATRWLHTTGVLQGAAE